MKLPTVRALVLYLHSRETVIHTLKWIIEYQKAELQALQTTLSSVK